MNKAEKAELEVALKARSIAFALRWSDPTQVPKPTVRANDGPGIQKAYGWKVNVHESSFVTLPGDVRPAWTSSVHHGDCDSGSASQNPRLLFGDRLAGLRAMRAEYELIAAKRLAAIDAEINAEIREPTVHPELKAKP